MFAITSVLESRSVDGGHAIEIDFGLDDASTHTLKISYEHNTAHNARHYLSGIRR
jgi:hypothetical protein